MKKVFTILLLNVSIGGFSQTLDTSAVVTSSLKKEEMFANAKSWIAKTYSNYKAVVQLEDNEQYKIIIKPVGRIATRFHPDYKYSIILDFKDNKFRYSFEDISIGFGVGGVNTIYSGYDFSERRISRANAVIDSLSKIRGISKREAKKIGEMRERAENEVLEEALVYRKIREDQIRLIKSMSDAITKKDDF